METTDRLVERATADGLAVVALRDPDPEIRQEAWRQLGVQATCSNSDTHEEN